MTDETETPPAGGAKFETDTVQADRAREQGLGLGARELEAQRDPGGVRTADEPIEADDAGRSHRPDGLQPDADA